MVSELHKATGTGGELANNVLTTVVREGCESVRNGANLESATSETSKRKNPTIPNAIAGSCEVVRATYDERRARESNPQLLPATDFESASGTQNPRGNEPSKAGASLLLPASVRPIAARALELLKRMTGDEQRAELERWESLYG